MDLHYLRVFNAVATQLNFSKTANDLHISQPAVSMQIKKLEEDLGLKLFDRIGKQVFLSQNGEVLYKYTKQIFELIQEAEEELYMLKGTTWGNIAMGATHTPGTYMLPNIMGRFKEKYPNVTTTLHISHIYEIFDMLHANRLDFAVIGGEIEAQESLCIEHLFEDEIVLIVSPNHPFANHRSIRKEELIDERFISHERGTQLYKMIQKIVTDRLNVPLNIALSIGSTDAIKQAVASNLGLSFVPSISIHQELEHGTLKVVKVKGYSWRYPFNLVYHRNKYFTPAAQNMIGAIKEYVHEIKSHQ